MATAIEMRRMRRVRSFGAADQQDIGCPPGYSANGDAQGNVWCENATGQRVSATLTPVVDAPPATQQASVTGGGLGVVGWGAVIAGALVLASVVMNGMKKGRR